MAMACTRKASCKCTECVAALGIFTSKDLVAVASSTVVFEESAAAAAEALAPVTADMARKVRALKPKVDNALAAPEPSAAAALRLATTVTKAPPAPAAVPPVSTVQEPTAPTAVESSSSSLSMLSVDDENNPKQQRRRLTGPRSSKIGISPAAIAAPTPTRAPSAEAPPAAARAPAEPKPAATDDDDAVDLSLPLETRLASGNWKLRKSAYDQLANPASRDVAQGLMDHVHQLVENEAHPSALDAGLEFARSVVAKLDACAGADKLVAGLCKRALVARAGTKQRAVALVQELVCVEPQATVNALVAGVANKNAKVAVVCLSTVRDVLAAFGAAALDTKALLAAVETGMAATPPAIRAEASALACDGVLWLGAAFKGLALSRAGNDAQKRELERKFDAVEPGGAPPRPTHVLRSASGVAAAAAAAALTGSNALDVFAMMPANDLLAHLPELALEAKLKEPKWADRKTALERVLALCGEPPKLVPTGDYAPLVLVLRRAVQLDANQAVVVQALLALNGLSEGLRCEFTPLARLLVPVLLERLREKKAPVMQACSALFASMARWGLSFTDDRVVAQLEEALAKPTPLLVAHVMHVIEHSLPETGNAAALAALVAKHTASADPAARAAANAAALALKQIRPAPAAAAATTAATTAASRPEPVSAARAARKPVALASEAGTQSGAKPSAAPLTTAAMPAVKALIKPVTKLAAPPIVTAATPAAPTAAASAVATTATRRIGIIAKPAPAVAAAPVELEALLPQLMGDQPSWKARESALEQLGAFLRSCAPPLALTRAVKDAGAALAKRVDDSQRNVGLRAVQLAGVLGRAVGGPACAQLLEKSLGEKLVLAMGDAKKAIAAAAEEALTACVVHDGSVFQPALAVVVKQSAAPVAGAKFAAKARLLAWVAERLPGEAVDDALKLALLELCAPVVACVSARDAPTRKAAVALGETVAAMVPLLAPQRFRASLRDLKEAQLRAVQPVVDDMLARAATHALNTSSASSSSAAASASSSSSSVVRAPAAMAAATAARPTASLKQPARPLTPPESLAEPTDEPPTPARFVASSTSSLAHGPETPPDADADETAAAAAATAAWDPTAPDVMDQLGDDVAAVAGEVAREAMFAQRVGVRTFELLDGMLDGPVGAHPLPFIRWALMHFASRDCSMALASNYVLFVARALAASADAGRLALDEAEVRVMVVLLASKLGLKQLVQQARRVFELLPRGHGVEGVVACIVAVAASDASTANELLDEAERLIAAHGHTVVLGKRLAADLGRVGRRGDDAVAQWARKCLAGELAGDLTPVAGVGRKGLLSLSVEQRLRGAKKPPVVAAATAATAAAVNGAPSTAPIEFTALAGDLDALAGLLSSSASPLRAGGGGGAAGGREALVVARAEEAMELVANVGQAPAWFASGKSWERHVEDCLPVDAVAAALCGVLVAVLQSGVGVTTPPQASRLARLAVSACAALAERRGLCSQLSAAAVAKLVATMCAGPSDNARLGEAMRAVATAAWLREAPGWLQAVLSQPVKADFYAALRSYLAEHDPEVMAPDALDACVALARLRVAEDVGARFVLDALQIGRVARAKQLVEAVVEAHDSGRVEQARADICKLHELDVDVDSLLEGRSAQLRVYVKQRLGDLARLDRLKRAVVESSPGVHNARLERLRAQVGTLLAAEP